ncbi:MAG TPA: protein translocase subunit SecF, partial [Methylophilaceae bacterium]|nr:protein translocase subunit SecF [Methylophilaceae bacterium]
MEIFRIKHDIPFMSYGRLTTAISLITFVLAVFFLAHRGLNLGVDFTGGTMMEVSYPQAANIPEIRTAVDSIGLRDATVQNFGNSRDVLIRLPVKAGLTSAQLSEKVLSALKKADSRVEMRRVEFVGPQVGEELYDNGALALLLVSIGIMSYLAIRFEWRFAVAAIIANMHDVVIILGFFAFFQWEFNLTVLAAVLAVLGYSVNESVVVFDRVRENFRKMRKASVAEVINNA